MADPNFRVLCAELADSVELLLKMRAVDARPMVITEDRVSRARAALDQPEPQGIDRFELGDAIRRSWLKHGQDTWCSIADDVLAELPGLAQPEPPSLKEQALAALGEMPIEPCLINGVDANAAVRAKYNTIRRALEALPDD